MVRAIPEIVAYPYPVGYDVVNYYIPVITNFQEHWPTVSGQFPLYVLILHFFQLLTNLQPQILVSASASILYGLFSVSLYLTSRKLLELNQHYSMYLTLFVIFQLPVLRTAWDLHKDVFSITILLISLSLIFPLRDKMSWHSLISSSVLASIAVLVDKMVGILFIASLMIFSFVVRIKHVIFLSLIITTFFAIVVAPQYGITGQSFYASTGNIENNLLNQEPYVPTKLLILFMLVNGLLLVPAGFGLVVSDNQLLKIALAVSIIGSFSWLAFPDSKSLAADRWIFLSGIFLAIFAGYGIIKYSQTIVRTSLRKSLPSCILGFSIILGLTYETMPYRFASSENILGLGIEPFGPVTMQFNSVPVEDTGELLETISWINENSPRNATIFGEKHWRGWMEIKLQEGRSFIYNSDQYGMFQFNQDCQPYYCYLLTLSLDSPYLGRAEAKQVYHGNLFSIYEIEEIKGTR